MHPLAYSERDHLAVPDLDPGPDRGGLSAKWKRGQDHARGCRDKGDPWLFLIDGRQPPAVEPNLGQTRAEWAAADDQQAGDAVCAQSHLKILRFTKYRRAAARHLLSLPDAKPASLWQEAGS
jgi:hypothetical protein